MTDFTLVDPKGWVYDLHSVYSAYIGFFQINNIPWFDRSWGHLFSSFEEFLAFSWPVITVTDAWTGRAHIVTRLTSIGAFLKMIKTRFGETLPQAPNILQVTPFETSSRHLRNVSDYATYKKLHSTLPAAFLSASKTRIRAGEPKTIQELWDRRDKTFLALNFTWSERNEKSCLEWGYAAIRCGHLEAQNHWPPIPDTNYRKGHFIVEEYVDKVVNKHVPNYPWQYAFGESQVITKAKSPQIIQAVISSLASPDSETTANSLVIVGHGIHNDLARLEEMKIKVPHNTLVIDISNYERSLYSAGRRGVILDPRTSKHRQAGTNLSLEQLLYTFTTPAISGSANSPDDKPVVPITLPAFTIHNSGNNAFMCLFALQMLLERGVTQVPTVKQGRIGRPRTISVPMNLAPLPTVPLMTINGNMGGMAYSGFPSPGLTPNFKQRSSSTYDLSNEFGQMQVGMSRPNLSGQHLSANPGRERQSKRFSTFAG